MFWMSISSSSCTVFQQAPWLRLKYTTSVDVVTCGRAGRRRQVHSQLLDLDVTDRLLQSEKRAREGSSMRCASLADRCDGCWQSQVRTFTV